MDVYVSNYRLEKNYLWVNDGAGNFTDQARLYNVDGIFDVYINDADAGVYPGALEACDGLDQDCDGQVDEDACAAEGLLRPVNRPRPVDARHRRASRYGQRSWPS